MKYLQIIMIQGGDVARACVNIAFVFHDSTETTFKPLAHNMSHQKITCVDLVTYLKHPTKD